MLVQHIASNDDIFIQIDADCDGFTSAAALINYINMFAPNYAQTHITYRLHSGKEHGLIVDTIPENVKLVIAPDASSNDYEEHQELYKKGIDVLVIDHHEADKISEYACVINNQLCDYPTKSLSGVGMVYKFCSYIDYLLNVDYAENLRDLVALGLIADMVDMKDFETKHLIMTGLENLRNPFFKNMVKKQEYSLSDEITPIGVAFYIAPYINAVIRMGTHDEKEILFKSMLDFEAYNLIPSTKRGAPKGSTESIVEQACRVCTNVKSRQTKARDVALDTVEYIIQQNDLLKNKVLAIKLEPQYATEKNLTGLIANQLMAKYQRPVLLLNKITHSDKSVTWEGSGRNYDKSQFTDFRHFLAESGLVLYAEGHSSAFGSGIADEQFDEFIAYSNEALKQYDFSPCYKVDFIFNGDNFKSKDIIEIAELNSVWGQGVSEPYIALENIKVHKDNVVLMSPDKHPTLKITLPNGTSLIKFKSSQEEYETFLSAGCYTLNIIGRCAKNVWNGNISAQILIEDYEITGVIQYYF